ncbi:hypothetical protein [Actinomadura atramentaria]|uniref:hypothetical protein n=1 Tax=Actinomadura atramentaria TaxID=1990 RepID=UPI00036A6278|nr:hypothetical protein [Actinomadura atramentaria]
MATYPKGVKTFEPKKDYVDDVLAAHVNLLQDEIRAIQQTIGIEPTLLGPKVNPSRDPRPTGGTRTYKDIRDRLRGLTWNEERPAIVTSIKPQWVRSNPYLVDDWPLKVTNFSAPMGGFDKGGRGILIPESGLWLLTGYVYWYPTSRTVGHRLLKITRADPKTGRHMYELTCDAGLPHLRKSRGVRQSVACVLPLNKGWLIRALVSQHSGRRMQIRGNLSAVWLRKK